MSTRRAFLIYAALTAILFSNLVAHVGTHLYSDLGDPLLNTAILAWNARHIPLTAEWWNFPAFAPLTGITAFTEHLLVTYPVATPIIWITDNPVLAYNVIFLLTFPANGVAAFALGRALTGSSAAAFITGLACAFAPYQSGRVSHVQTLLQFGMALALLGAHRYLDSGRRRHLALFGGGWLLATGASAYTLVFFPILFAMWCLWFVRPAQWVSRLLPLAATATIATLPLAPLLLGYVDRQSTYGLIRLYGEAKQFSADIAGIVGAPHRLLLWRQWLPTTFGEASLFPGLTILALAVVGVASSVRAWNAPHSVWPRRLAILTALLAGVALARALFGASGWRVGSVALPPFQPYRIFTFAALCGLAALLVTSRFKEAWRSRNVVVFYAIAVVAFWLLTLGPEPLLHGERALTYGPYRLLYQLPGVAAIRVPARAWLPAVLCLAVLAGFGTAALLRRRWSRPPLVVAAIALLMLAEGWFRAEVQPAPVRLTAGAIPPGVTALDIPVGDVVSNTEAQYRAVLGGYRVVNGYSGYAPERYAAWVKEIGAMSDQALNEHRQDSDLYVIVPLDHRDEDRWIAAQAGAHRVVDLERDRIYLLPRLAFP